MVNNNNKRIIFDLPTDADTADVINEILKDNDLKETLDERFDKIINNEDSKLVIIRDAAIILVQKKISEEKLVEFLQKHLGISMEIARKVVTDIKEKLIPYAKIIDVKKEEELREKEEKTKKQKEDIQEALLEKIRNDMPFQKSEEKLPASYLKKIEITDVEKNAEEMEKEGMNVISKEKNKFTKKEEVKSPQTQKNKPDVYREPIE